MMVTKPLVDLAMRALFLHHAPDEWDLVCAVMAADMQAVDRILQTAGCLLHGDLALLASIRDAEHPCMFRRLWEVVKIDDDTLRDVWLAAAECGHDDALAEFSKSEWIHDCDLALGVFLNLARSGHVQHLARMSKAVQLPDCDALRELIVASLRKGWENVVNALDGPPDSWWCERLEDAVGEACTRLVLDRTNGRANEAFMVGFPLMHAVLHNDSQNVTLLLALAREYGVDGSLIAVQSNVCLAHAAQFSRPETVAALLQAPGADPNSPLDSRQLLSVVSYPAYFDLLRVTPPEDLASALTPLTIAAALRCDDTAVLSTILGHPTTDVRAWNDMALCVAAFFGRTRSVQLLLRAGAGLWGNLYEYYHGMYSGFAGFQPVRVRGEWISCRVLRRNNALVHAVAGHQNAAFDLLIRECMRRMPGVRNEIVAKCYLDAYKGLARDVCGPHARIGRKLARIERRFRDFFLPHV